MIGSVTQIGTDGVSKGHPDLMTVADASLSSSDSGVLSSTVAQDHVFLAGLFRTKVSSPGLLNMIQKVRLTEVGARTFRQSFVGCFNGKRR